MPGSLGGFSGFFGHCFDWYADAICFSPHCSCVACKVRGVRWMRGSRRVEGKLGEDKIVSVFLSVGSIISIQSLDCDAGKIQESKNQRGRMGESCLLDGNLPTSGLIDAK